ncbi:MAG: cob(I)yrinic acid a,c-diamide adenosyltransferase [Verrucomicrobia bacterium]|nr:cob(I)yrinic acid a,c-diamide adenosyltransferase [Verrucomicrobiota bacterium]
MSIVTRTGDCGTTGLMYNRRVPKHHPRVEAYGSVDELSAALGVVRAQPGSAPLRPHLLAAQRDLIALMGELATDFADSDRYARAGHPRIAPLAVQRLDDLAQELESQFEPLKSWAIPGPPPLAAALEVARATCRRAERRVCALHDAGQLGNPSILEYLNRLADVLWLAARWAERPRGRRRLQAKPTVRSLTLGRAKRS